MRIPSSDVNVIINTKYKTELEYTKSTKFKSDLYSEECTVAEKGSEVSDVSWTAQLGDKLGRGSEAQVVFSLTTNKFFRSFVYNS